MHSICQILHLVLKSLTYKPKENTKNVPIKSHYLFTFKIFILKLKLKIESEKLQREKPSILVHPFLMERVKAKTSRATWPRSGKPEPHDGCGATLAFQLQVWQCLVRLIWTMREYRLMRNFLWTIYDFSQKYCL